MQIKSAALTLASQNGHAAEYNKSTVPKAFQMPIFSKDNETVYFAHIPKTAGSSVCIVFLQNGWSIANVQTSAKNKGRIGYRIFKEFGIEKIPTVGSRHGYKWSLQHAPASVWPKWGEFDSSFAILRDPYRRFISSVAYHARVKGIKDAPDALVDHCVNSLIENGDKNPDEFAPLFRRQVDFVTPETRLIKLEDGWQSKLEAFYGLKIERNEYVNKSKPHDIRLKDKHRAFIDHYYKDDFALWDGA